MNNSDWDKIQAIFQGALARPADQRQAYVAEQCAGDSALLREVQSLLNADGDETVFNLSASQAIAELEDGEYIGPYKVLGEIGIGGMGVVYKGYDARLERYVAIKRIPAHLHYNEAIKQRFLTEARAASRLDHPNICVIYDFAESEDGSTFLTMAYYEGETLAERMMQGALHHQEAIKLTHQIGLGLAAAHEQGIVHRDIKPSNIMLTKDDRVKILDFGVAKVTNVDLTATGASIGTLGYSSPEQLRGDSVDARTDIWALGATFYEMLTGSKAFPGKNLPDIILAVLSADNGEFVKALQNQVPYPLVQVLEKMLATRVENRYENINLLLDDLQQLPLSQGANLGSQVGVRSFSQGTKWNDEAIAVVANLLLPYLGPIAKKLTQHTAEQVNDVAGFRKQLGEHLPDTKVREAFFQKFDAQLGEINFLSEHSRTQAGARGGGGQNFELSGQELAALQSVYTSYIGPIAGPMIKRNVTQVSSLKELCINLSEQLHNKQERERFLKEVALLLE